MTDVYNRSRTASKANQGGSDFKSSKKVDSLHDYIQFYISQYEWRVHFSRHDSKSLAAPVKNTPFFGAVFWPFTMVKVHLTYIDDIDQNIVSAWGCRFYYSHTKISLTNKVWWSMIKKSYRFNVSNRFYKHDIGRHGNKLPQHTVTSHECNGVSTHCPFDWFWTGHRWFAITRVSMSRRHQDLALLFVGVMYQFNKYSNRKWQDYVYIQCEYKSTKQKIKHLLREENKVKENKIS